MPSDFNVTPQKKIRVLVIDDSALVRRMLTEILNSDPGIEVIATAPDPIIARDLIKAHNPDVLTLDVEMPRMTGLAFLENLMRLRPMPVVMVSSLTQRGADVTLDALGLGAFDFVSKPRLDLSVGLEVIGAEVISKVKAASRYRPAARRAGLRSGATTTPAAAPSRLATTSNRFSTTDKLFVIGASTGGTEAIRELLAGMPADAPGMVIAQHIPAAFSGPFAARLDRDSPLKIVEAKGGERILPGHVFIAPGGRHMWVDRSGAQWYCKLSDDPPVNQHRPSVDYLFASTGRAAGVNVVAALLTGMGDDGARELKSLRDLGATTIAQDEASSVVWGMPGSAVRLGAAQQVLPLNRIAAAMIRAAQSDSNSRLPSLVSQSGADKVQQ